MKSKVKYILYTIAAVILVGCEKNDPITELGTTNHEYSAQLSVTYNNTRPAIDDTVIVTASTWQRDDRYDRIVFYETLYETFGLNISLEYGSSFRTVEDTYTTLSLTDTIHGRTAWLTVSSNELLDYWVTNTNNYVIRGEYVVNLEEGQYPSNENLINVLPANEWEALLSIIAYGINAADFNAIFPGAPAGLISGTLLNAVGREYLRSNLTRQLLIDAVSNIAKLGTYNVVIEVEAITPTGAITATTRTFTNDL